MIARISRWLLSVIFLYAGLTKLADPQRFAVVIDGFGLLPESFVMPVAVLLPVFECVVAAGLFFNIRPSLYAISALMIVFIGVLSYGIWLGLDIDCGCFGPEDPEQAYHSLKAALLRDLFFLVPILYLFWFQGKTDRREAIPSC